MIVDSLVSAIADLLGKLLDAGKGLPGLRRDEKRKEILREQLEEPNPLWCSLGTLAGLVGSSEKRTKDLLISIGARGSRGSKKDMWALQSRLSDAKADPGQPTEEA
jgi:hypothetical protein